ncbi:MAG: hypothetical protein HYY16_04680 [Planctomycetes bacterium]|nr:hypothetical protein [Planctomycetota bacterium]
MAEDALGASHYGRLTQRGHRWNFNSPTFSLLQGQRIERLVVRTALSWKRTVDAFEARDVPIEFQ